MQVVAIFLASMAICGTMQIPSFVNILNGGGFTLGRWWWFFSFLFAVWGAFVQYMTDGAATLVVWLAFAVWVPIGMKVIDYAHEQRKRGN